MMYLTGFQEPEAVLIMRGGSATCTNTETPAAPWSTLFVANRNLQKEVWDGPRVDPLAAAHMFGVDHAEGLDKLPAMLEDGVYTECVCI